MSTPDTTLGMVPLPAPLRSGSILALVVGVLGLLATAGGAILATFTTALMPTMAAQLAEQHVMFGSVAQVVGTAIGALCYAALIFGSVMTLSRSSLGPRVVRIACVVILAQSVVGGALALPYVLDPSGIEMSAAMLRATLLAAGVTWLIMLVLYGTIFFLMRPSVSAAHGDSSSSARVAPR